MFRNNNNNIELANMLYSFSSKTKFTNQNDFLCLKFEV